MAISLAGVMSSRPAISFSRPMQNSNWSSGTGARGSSSRKGLKWKLVSWRETLMMAVWSGISSRKSSNRSP